MHEVCSRHRIPHVYVNNKGEIQQWCYIIRFHGAQALLLPGTPNLDVAPASELGHGVSPVLEVGRSACIVFWSWLITVQFTNDRGGLTFRKGHPLLLA